MLEKLKINPDIDKIIEEKGLDRDTTLVALFAFTHCSDVNVIIDANILDEHLENQLRLHLLNKDHLNDRYVLRVPLFTLLDNSEYDDFVQKLIDLNMTSHGLELNQTKYHVFSDDDELKTQYNNVKLRLGKEFDQDKLVDTIIAYYRHSDSPKGLTNYLRGGAVIDYRNGKTSGSIIRGDF
jgi:hypothetical protein